MAKYNTFVVCVIVGSIKYSSYIFCKKSKRKAIYWYKSEIWNGNTHVETIYSRKVKDIYKYIELEKQYIAKKQINAQIRNDQRRRKNHGL